MDSKIVSHLEKTKNTCFDYSEAAEKHTPNELELYKNLVNQVFGEIESYRELMPSNINEALLALRANIQGDAKKYARKFGFCLLRWIRVPAKAGKKPLTTEELQSLTKRYWRPGEEDAEEILPLRRHVTDQHLPSHYEECKFLLRLNPKYRPIDAARILRVKPTNLHSDFKRAKAIIIKP
jgi:hypothetical protein